MVGLLGAVSFYVCGWFGCFGWFCFGVVGNSRSEAAVCWGVVAEMAGLCYPPTVHTCVLVAVTFLADTIVFTSCR